MSDKILLRGLPASPGIAQGRVKILGIGKNDSFNPGDVLVTRVTTPLMTPQILKASAIVTDVGGVTSHPAIIARELGIPAVVSTRKATQILSDEMMVVVDGSNGVVCDELR